MNWQITEVYFPWFWRLGIFHVGGCGRLHVHLRVLFLICPWPSSCYVFMWSMVEGAISGLFVRAFNFTYELTLHHHDIVTSLTTQIFTMSKWQRGGQRQDLSLQQSHTTSSEALAVSPSQFSPSSVRCPSLYFAVTPRALFSKRHLSAKLEHGVRS